MIEADARTCMLGDPVDAGETASSTPSAWKRSPLADELRATGVHTRALEATANAVIITDAAGSIVWVNPAFTAMTGYASAEVLGHNPRILKSGRQERAIYESLWSTIRSGRVWSGELVNRRRDGTLYTEEMTITPLRSETGAVTHFIAIKQDVTRRKEVEAALLDSQRRYGALMEHATDAAFILCPEGTIVEANRQAGMLLGAPPGQVIGRHISEFAPDPSVEATNEKLFRDGVAAGGGMVPNVSLRRGDGRLIEVDFSISLHQIAGKESVLSVGRDVTERNRAAAELRAAQQRLHHVVSSSPAALFTLKVEGGGPVFVCTWVSDNVERLLGYKAEEILAPSGWESRLHPEDRARVFAEIGRLFGEGRLVQEYRFRDKAGAYRWLRDEKIVLRDGTGTPLEVVGSWSDVSERKKTELQLYESEEKYRVLFDSNPHPMWVFDAESLAFLAVNEAAVRHYGYEREEWLAMTVLDIRPSEEIPAFRAAYAGPGQDMPGLHSAGSKHRKKDGTVIEVDIAASSIIFEGRRARLILATDVTEKRGLEAQLVQSQKMESVGRLAGGVAHDFNNLLGIIGGYGELLRKRVAAEPRLRKYAEDIVKAADRAAGLTRQLLAFSRKQILQPKILDLNGVVGDMERMLRRVIGEDIQLVTVSDLGLGTVKADPGQIEQVLMNLAVNARDAMPTGGRLTIETHNVDLDATYARRHPNLPPGRYVMLAVTDTGHGMSAEVKARLFEPFFTTKEPGKGTGLGLATVHGIVAQSGGHVFVYSEEGHGTAFKVYFPRTETAPPPDGEAGAEPEVPRGTETVLLVEDEGTLRQLIREYLEAAGYTVLEAAHGAEALKIAQTHPGDIDLLLTDVVMPGMSGAELAVQAGSTRPGMRRLYMSGYTDDAVVLHGVLGEEMSFLQKPFTEKALARKVREVLDARG